MTFSWSKVTDFLNFAVGITNVEGPEHVMDFLDWGRWTLVKNFVSVCELIIVYLYVLYYVYDSILYNWRVFVENLDFFRFLVYYREEDGDHNVTLASAVANVNNFGLNATILGIP